MEFHIDGKASLVFQGLQFLARCVFRMVPPKDFKFWFPGQETISVGFPLHFSLLLAGNYRFLSGMFAKLLSL